MIIASLAILLILMHVRSAVLICMTLPLAVLVSFILMKYFNVSSNIMSLSGIAISIGILVDQAIVMVENATHHLTAHFGPGKRIEGDTREIVIRACRTVGRPIFFSVMIILLSFVPVFAFTGREGKTFHPLAFTKSFAMIGVAVISITLVPALIPSFIKGRLRSEDESWLVRNLIGIYKPWLTWLMPRRNFAMWSFSALLIVGAGLFPLDAVIGVPGKTCFLAIVGRDDGDHDLPDRRLALAVAFVRHARRPWPWRPTTSPRSAPTTCRRWTKAASSTCRSRCRGCRSPQASADLKTRDAIIRRFPEVELIVGKAGRADTPTDPSPLDMVESVITLRPKEHWPKRKLDYKDAQRQMAVVLDALQKQNLIEAIPDGLRAARADGPGHDERRVAVRRDDAGDGATAVHGVRRPAWPQAAAGVHRGTGCPLAKGRPPARADQRRRDRPARRGIPEAIRADPCRRSQSGGHQPPDAEDRRKAGLAAAAAKRSTLNPDLLAANYSPLYDGWLNVAEVLGAERPTLFTDMWQYIVDQRDRQWRQAAAQIDDEILDCAAATYDLYAIDELQQGGPG